MLSPQALRIAGALIVAASTPLAVLAQAPSVAWRSDFEQAKVEAAQSGRLVLLHFTTKRCAPCKVLDKAVFSQPGVGPAMEQDFVPVRVDADDNQALAMNFRIDRVPTEIIISPDGKVLANPPIPDKPEPYLAQLQNIARHYRQAPAVAAQPAQPVNVNNAYANLPMATAAQQSQAQPPQAQAPAPQIAANPAAGAAGAAGQSQANPYAAASQTPANPFAASQSNPYGATPPAPVNNPYAAAANGGRYGSANNVYAAKPAQQSAEATQPSAVQAAPPAAANSAVASNPAMPGNAMPRSYGAEPGSVAASAPVVGAAVAAGAAPSAGAGSSLSTPVAAGAVGAVAVASTAQKPQAPQLPAGSPQLAFDGYCPVTLKTLNHWTLGNSQFGAVHRGRTYLFAGAEQRDQFLASPDAYSPVFAGLDPVMLLDKQQSVEGKRALGYRYGDAFYLFSSEETKQKFAASPQTYAAGVRQAMSRIDSADGTVRR